MDLEAADQARPLLLAHRKVLSAPRCDRRRDITLNRSTSDSLSANASMDRCPESRRTELAQNRDLGPVRESSDTTARVESAGPGDASQQQSKEAQRSAGLMDAGRWRALHFSEQRVRIVSVWFPPRRIPTHGNRTSIRVSRTRRTTSSSRNSGVRNERGPSILSRQDVLPVVATRRPVGRPAASHQRVGSAPGSSTS
jgi:hypothetical protein